MSSRHYEVCVYLTSLKQASLNTVLFLKKILIFKPCLTPRRWKVIFLNPLRDRHHRFSGCISVNTALGCDRRELSRHSARSLPAQLASTSVWRWGDGVLPCWLRIPSRTFFKIRSNSESNENLFLRHPFTLIYWKSSFLVPSADTVKRLQTDTWLLGLKKRPAGFLYRVKDLQRETERGGNRSLCLGRKRLLRKGVLARLRKSICADFVLRWKEAAAEWELQVAELINSKSPHPRPSVAGIRKPELVYQWAPNRRHYLDSNWNCGSWILGGGLGRGLTWGGAGWMGWMRCILFLGKWLLYSLSPLPVLFAVFPHQPPCVSISHFFLIPCHYCISVFLCRFFHLWGIYYWRARVYCLNELPLKKHLSQLNKWQSKQNSHQTLTRWKLKTNTHQGKQHKRWFQRSH